ncbi:hypothetical protein B0H14DRAFT_2643338 [Mycena olivaceomarginata]|nr:hypothetical protein B0H14DRAFT_2643338 [Mycena olivaceomarginata]
MVNRSGANGRYNGTRPPDSVLGPTLHEYTRKSLSLDQRCDYLFKDFGYKIGNLHSRNSIVDSKFQLSKKPPPDHIASTLVAEVMQNNVSSLNAPRTVQIRFPFKMESRFPETLFVVLWPKLIQTVLRPDSRVANASPNNVNSLTDTGVYYKVGKADKRHNPLPELA